jgi:hypothetical protein
VTSKDHIEYRRIGFKPNVPESLFSSEERKILRSPQSKGNLKYRYVHLVLANAQKLGWDIEHYPIENVAKQDLNSREVALINEFECNMNDGSTWFIEQFSELSEQLLKKVLM